jgi:hypothetical protein
VGNYRQPRKLNSVSVVMLVLFAAAGYWMWVFFPVYWDAWTVDHQLREAASSCYRINKIAEPNRSQELRKVLKKVQEDSIRLAHIRDPDFDVTLDIEGDTLFIHATYKVTVKHPVGNFVTVLDMKRTEKANIKQVSWD